MADISADLYELKNALQSTSTALEKSSRVDFKSKAIAVLSICDITLDRHRKSSSLGLYERGPLFKSLDVMKGLNAFRAEL